VTLVAIMTVRRAALELFRTFERHAAAVMADVPRRTGVRGVSN